MPDVQFQATYEMPETARFLPGEAKTYTKSMESVGKYANFVFEKEGDWICLAIEAADTPGLLGEVVLKWLPGCGQAEIGWSLAPEARGKGIATEAAGALLQLGFGELHFHRINAKLDALNTASAALCERLGMRLESTQVDKWHYKGTVGHRSRLRHPRARMDVPAARVGPAGLTKLTQMAAQRLGIAAICGESAECGPALPHWCTHLTRMAAMLRAEPSI